MIKLKRTISKAVPKTRKQFYSLVWLALAVGYIALKETQSSLICIAVSQILLVGEKS